MVKLPNTGIIFFVSGWFLAISFIKLTFQQKLMMFRFRISFLSTKQKSTNQKNLVFGLFSCSEF